MAILHVNKNSILTCMHYVQNAKRVQNQQIIFPAKTDTLNATLLR